MERKALELQDSSLSSAMVRSAATLWIDPQPLVLASRSRYRQALCAAAGIPIESRPADIDERALQLDLARTGATPSRIALTLARAKARVISDAVPGRLVAGSDQTLSFGTEILSKPPDRAAAARQLEQLSGRAHQLHAAVVVMRDGASLFETIETAHLTMRPLSPAFIRHYLDAAGDEVCSSVGAYQIEGLGIHLFASIDGDQTTILGMPMLPLIGFLRAHGSVAT